MGTPNRNYEFKHNINHLILGSIILELLRAENKILLFKILIMAPPPPPPSGPARYASIQNITVLP
jgi:hypothetical protein